LNQAGRDYDIVFATHSLTHLLAAVAAGLGVTLLPSRSVPADLGLVHVASLPKPPELWCGIYLRDGADCELTEELADTMGEVLRPRPEGVTARPQVAWPTASDPLAVRARGRS
jgi:DNA-binding transcriptional LysR family regulator